MVAEPTPIVRDISREGNPLPARPPRRRKSGDLPLIVTRITDDHYTCTSSSRPLLAYDITRDGPGDDWRCDCEARIQHCRHVAEVERYATYLEEPVTLPTPAEIAKVALEVSGLVPFPAATRTTSGPAMQVITERMRRIRDAAGPRPAEQPAAPCEWCGRPASPHYTNPVLCNFCGFRAAF